VKAAAASEGILVVEDDSETRRVLAEALAAEGQRVVAVGAGEAGSKALRSGGIAAIVLDVWLPDRSGIDLCRDWRRSGILVPILMLTARTDVASRVEGLDAGADDYLGKPFALSELRARLRALLRRGARPVQERVFEGGGLRLDFGRRQAWLGSVEVPLTRRELDVLERLFSARGHAVSRDDLLEDVWGEATPETAASLEVIVARLRRKLEAPAGAGVIRTLRGYGYALSASPRGDEV
jgi:two-component system, OmpR family, response regulator